MGGPASSDYAGNPRGNEPTLGLHELRFLDVDGAERSNFRTLVQDRIRVFPEGGRVLLEVEFPEPTYLSGLPRLNKQGDPIGNVKILRLSATLDVQTKPLIVPMSSKAMATYLFKKAMETDERYVLIAEDGEEIVARLSGALSGGAG